MKKLAVMTAVVFLFGVAGSAAAFQPNYNQDPLIEANNNDLVGGGGTNANAGDGVAVAVTDALNGNSLGSNNSETVDVDKSADGGQSAATTGGTAVGLTDSANGNSLLSGNDTNNVEAEGWGNQAAGDGGTNVNQEAFIIENDLPGSNPTTTTTTSTSTATTKNTGNNAIGADSANAKNYSDNPSADDGSQQVIGDGDHTLNLADDGAVVATGASIVTQNEADKGGMINTGDGNLNKVTNEGKYAAQNANQNINEENYEIEAEGFGNIAAFGNVTTMNTEKGATAVGFGSAASFTEMDGEVKGNFISFGYNDASAWSDSGDADTGKNDSGNAYTGKADSGDADTGKNDSGSAFAISGSKSKSGAAGAAAFGGSLAGGNGAAAFSGAKSESDADAVAVDAISLFGGADADADSDDSKAKSAAGAVAASISKNVSDADADSGSSDSKSKAKATSGNVDSGDATSGYADSGDATSGYADSGDATSGRATSNAGSITNSFATGANTLTVSSFNGLGNFHMDSSVGSLTQQSINVNAVVGGNAFGN